MCLVGFAADVTDGVAETGVSWPFLAAVVSPRHRTAIDCQTRATQLFYCSALDPFAPFATSSAKSLGRRSISCFRVGAARPTRASRWRHRRIILKSFRSSMCGNLQQSIRHACDACLLPVQAAARGHLERLRSLLGLDSLLNYVALAPLSPAIGPATNRDDLQLTIYSNSCVVVVSESCGRALLRPDRSPLCTKHLRSAYRSERGG